MLRDGVLDELDHVVFIPATEERAFAFGVLSDREIEDDGHAEIIAMFACLLYRFMILIGFLSIIEDASALPFKRRCFRRIMPTMLGDYCSVVCRGRNG